MLQKLREIKRRWEDELSAKYGGELEVDYINGTYFVCAFHPEPKAIESVQYDNWIEKVKEFECLGNSKEIESYCSQLGIQVCH